MFPLRAPRVRDGKGFLHSSKLYFGLVEAGSDGLTACTPLFTVPALLLVQRVNQGLNQGLSGSGKSLGQKMFDFFSARPMPLHQAVGEMHMPTKVEQRVLGLGCRVRTA